MKFLEKGILFSSVFFFQAATAQHVRFMDGDLGQLRGEHSINVEFGYDNMRVGKYDREADYISNRKDEYNKKEPGKGDNWAKAWVDDRKYRYEPKLLDGFQRFSEMKADPQAKYTLIFKTMFTEPGFNGGVVRKAATIDAEAWVVETANRDHVIAKISIQKAPARNFWGNDFDAGERIAEAYQSAGVSLGRFIRDKAR
jgi:hypothetical protein